MKNQIVDKVEVAPNGCVVCFKPHPRTDNTPGWTYLAGSIPIGAITCSTECSGIAMRRHETTGRVDTPAMRAQS